jgi:hypothetical protein
MNGMLEKIGAQARKLRELTNAERKATGKRSAPGDLWLSGAYTEHNREHN